MCAQVLAREDARAQAAAVVSSCVAGTGGAGGRRRDTALAMLASDALVVRRARTEVDALLGALGVTGAEQLLGLDAAAVETLARKIIPAHRTSFLALFEVRPTLLCVPVVCVFMHVSLSNDMWCGVSFCCFRLAPAATECGCGAVVVVRVCASVQARQRPRGRRRPPPADRRPGRVGGAGRHTDTDSGRHRSRGGS